MAFYVTNLEAYNQQFKVFRNEKNNKVVKEKYLNDAINVAHWHERNQDRFKRLELDANK